MEYECRECKRKHNTVEARLRCQCGADLSESIMIADRRRVEEFRSRAPNGAYAVEDHRKIGKEFRCEF